MKPKRKNEILLGGFILAALMLFVLLLSLMGTLGRLFEPTTEVRVFFSDIRGLKSGDPVSFLGSKVGRVTDVEFSRRRWGEEFAGLFPGESGERTRVVITLEIPRRIHEFLRADTPVEIDKNLTGKLTVLLGDGTGGSLPLEGAALKGSPGVSLATIAGRVDETLKTLDPAIENLAGLMNRLAGSKDLDRAMEDLAIFTQQLSEGIGPIRELLAGSLQEMRDILRENRENIHSTTSNLAKGTELVHKVLEKVEPASGGLQKALDQVEKAGAALTDAIGDNRPRIDAIVEDIRRAIANAANLTADVRRRPWRLLYQPSEADLETLDLYDAAWAYNLGAADLERTLNNLSLQLTADPDGNSRNEAALRTAYLEVEESLRRHREAEDAFWTRLRER